jgi:uncharacterized protein (DUF2062 family)
MNHVETSLLGGAIVTSLLVGAIVFVVVYGAAWMAQSRERERCAKIADAEGYGIPIKIATKIRSGE